MNIMLLVFSILPVFLIGYYIYNKDKNKESNGLIVKLLLGGLGAAVITVIASLIIELIFNISMTTYTIYSEIELLFYAFICVALIEEVSKWLVLYKIGFKNVEYNEAYDMLLYGAFVGLGFACIENILYVSTGGIETAITRALTAVPMHAILGVIMGYYLDKLRENINVQNNYKVLSIIIPILIHGLYDYCLMIEIGVVSMALLIGTFIYALKLINEVSKKSVVVPKINNNENMNISSIQNNLNQNINTQNNYQENFCSTCGSPYEQNSCKVCGRKRK